MPAGVKLRGANLRLKTYTAKRIIAPMIDLAEVIRQIEARAKRRGVDIESVLDAAGVHRSTWNRWRAGTHFPQLRKLQGIERAVETAKRSAA